MRRLPSSITACLAGLSLVGCSSEQGTYVGDRSNPIYATQSLGDLEAVIPEPLPVRSVIAAAEATLRDRGYTIWSTRTTDERGKIEARPPGRQMGRPWKVESWAASRNQTAIAISGGPWDDDQAARVLMDAILQRLGR